MRLRMFPAVLRMHRFKEEKDAHEFFFSELLLYKHWRSEDELYPNDFNSCLNMFQTKHSHDDILVVNWVKNNLFPEMNNVEMARAVLEEFTEIRPSHIGDVIDAQNAQDQEDQQFEGIQLEPDHDVRAYEGNFREGGSGIEMAAKFKRSDISDIDEMLNCARQLVPEQRLVFDQIIGFVKELRKYMEGAAEKPSPPLFVIHGGAGSGKSTLLGAISKWVDKILTTNDNRDLNNPFVIRCAPTGMAAHNIDGLTLCSAFHFKFDNDHHSYANEDTKTKFQDMLSHLQLLIIDEMSMVKADELYKLDLKLQEIKNNDNIFGGIGVLLFGDLMQLQPVKGRWIYSKPALTRWINRFAWDSLWDNFTPFILKENHRQGENKEWADTLNRLRYGLHTSEDIDLIRSRIVQHFPIGVPDDALFIYGKKYQVEDYNLRKLSILDGDLYSVNARHIHPSTTNYKPAITAEGAVSDTYFLDLFKFKIGARVMLIHNVATTDGLTNGACGQVIGVEQTEDHIDKIIVEFDNADTGLNFRTQFGHIQEKYPNVLATPISRVSVEYSIGKQHKGHEAKAKVVQFPLKLAWAITAHKVQGQTIKSPRPVAMDLQSTFTKAQAYVMLGRTENLQQIYLADFDNGKLGCNTNSLEESQSLEKKAEQYFNENVWLSNADLFRVSHLNIRSLKNHFMDLACDSHLLKSDIIGISETWFPKTGFLLPELPAFDTYRQFYASAGRGKGVALFIKDNLAVVDTQKLCTQQFQVLKVTLELLTVIVVYRSPATNSCDLLIDALLTLITNTSSTIIMGDFNIDPKKNPKQYHNLNSAMISKGFEQIIDRATHMKGHMLDHMYLQSIDRFSWQLHHPYWSDHDATCLQCEL